MISWDNSCCGMNGDVGLSGVLLSSRLILVVEETTTGYQQLSTKETGFCFQAGFLVLENLFQSHCGFA
jgi:hypothetical protein